MTVAPRSSERGLRHTVHASELLPPELPYVSAGLLSVLLLLYLLLGRNGQKDTPTARRIDRPGKGHLLFSCAEWRCLPPVACKVLQLSAVFAGAGFLWPCQWGACVGYELFVLFVCGFCVRESCGKRNEQTSSWDGERLVARKKVFRTNAISPRPSL